MKTKVQKFREWVNNKSVRKQLVESGIKYSVVYSWGKTDRLPTENNAKLISAIFGKPLSEIPYYRTERVI